MNEQQLRELIRLASQAALLFSVTRQFIGGKKPEQGDATDSKPTGLRRFLPWGKRDTEEDSSQYAQKRVDEIIRSVMPDFEPAEKRDDDSSVDSREWAERRVDEIIRSVTAGHDAPTEPEADLKSVISGAVERQDGVSSGQQGPVDQPKVPGIISTAPSESGSKSTPEPSRTSNLVDTFQLGLDVVGAFDPMPIADGMNAAISLGRAFVTDPERRKEHLQNAAISAVSMVPYVGDTAKLAKVPRAAKTVQRTSQMVRGADRVTGTAKAATAAEKRAARNSYRDTASQAIGSSASADDDRTEGASPAALGAPAAGGGEPPGREPPVMAPAPGSDDNPNLRNASEEAEGLGEYSSWRESIKDSGKKLMEFGGIVGKGVLKIAGFVQGLQLLNTGVLALNRDLAAYNGQIAGAYARADAADIRRDMRRSQALSGPLSGLSDEQTELKNTISSLTIPMQQIGVGILEKTTSLVNWTVRVTGIIEPAVSALEWLASFFGRQEDANQATAWMTFFQDVSDGKFDGQRPRFIGGRRQILDDPDHKEVFGP